jgi:hypothetical protein
MAILGVAKMNKELKDWLKINSACHSGINRALALNITDMQDAYNRAEPMDLIWAVTREKVLTKKQRAQFILFCAKQVDNLLSDKCGRKTISGIEDWLNGKITQKKMKKIGYDTFFHATNTVVSSFSYAVANVFNHDDSNAAYTFATIVWGYTSPTPRKQQAEWIRENIPFESLNLIG